MIIYIYFIRENGSLENFIYVFWKFGKFCLKNGHMYAYIWSYITVRTVAQAVESSDGDSRNASEVFASYSIQAAMMMGTNCSSSGRVI